MLQVYAFVYQRLMDFPQRRFDYETLTTNELFDSVHIIINFKIHLHHSHTTGEKYLVMHVTFVMQRSEKTKTF